jgi:DNA segregation ATPase FtsK/SpoIIIE, S-DNA-T family
MASYPSPQREPLLDRQVQAELTRRGRELLGLALMGLAVLLGLTLWSYAP